MIILTTQKKNHEKISTQSKAIVYWMGTVFSLKMPLFFLTILVSSHIATAPLDLGMKYLWFWGPQTYYYLNLRGQVNLWYSHFHQEQHMRQHCAIGVLQKTPTSCSEQKKIIVFVIFQLVPRQAHAEHTHTHSPACSSKPLN